jgi:hypothetical protein
VLRDDRRRVLLSGAKPLLCILSPEHAELMTLKLGFEFIHDFLYFPLLLILDYENLSTIGGIIAQFQEDL